MDKSLMCSEMNHCKENTARKRFRTLLMPGKCPRNPDKYKYPSPFQKKHHRLFCLLLSFIQMESYTMYSAFTQHYEIDPCHAIM